MTKAAGKILSLHEIRGGKSHEWLFPLSIVSNKLITTSDNLLQLTIYRLLHLGVVIRVSFTTFQKQEKAKEWTQKSYVVRLKEKKSESAAAGEPRRPLKRKKERKSGRRRIELSA